MALQIKRKLDLYLSTCQLGITMTTLLTGYVMEPSVGSLIHAPLAADVAGDHRPGAPRLHALGGDRLERRVRGRERAGAGVLDVPTGSGVAPSTQIPEV